MKDGCVTLDEVFAAAAARAASLVPETSGYLALAALDASSRLPLAHDDCALVLTTEGSMSLSRRGEVVAPEAAAKAMRDVLARLLAVSAGTMPSLAAAARPREESSRGVDAVIEQIEAALIPVNRAAARRALARLARETLRAKEAGKLRPKREASGRPPPQPTAAATAEVAVLAAENEKNEHAHSSRAVFSEPPPFAPKTATPAPAARVESSEAETVIPDEQIVVAYAALLVETPTPPRLDRAGFGEPTPTTLGMAIEIDEAPTPLSAMEMVHATVLGHSALVQENASPVIHAAVVERVVISTPAPAMAIEPARVAPKTTRADDLLATFAVSCSDEAAVREATDCLKKLAGLEPTPPPLAVARRAPAAPTPAPTPKKIARATTPRPPVAAAPAPKATPALDAIGDQLEEDGRAPRKRSRPGLSLFAALLAGAVVALVAVLRFRPDLVGSFEERTSAAPGSERPAAPAAAAR